MTASNKPPCSDAAVKARTGRNWMEWSALLDAEGAHQLEHAEIAKLVHRKHRAGGWWSQMVTVGYERLRGLRAVNQRRSGSFEASVSKTLATGAAAAFLFFKSPGKRERWLKEPIVIRRATPPKSLRITWPDETSVEVWITSKGDAKCSVGLTHTKLADMKAVEKQKRFWRGALDRLAAAIDAKGPASRAPKIPPRR
ncbi:MAG: hypothetical protein ACREU7_14070 [Burkholderiales bacterium]